MNEQREKKLVIALVALLCIFSLLLIVFFAFFYQFIKVKVSAAHQVQREIERLKQKGEPIRWNEIVPPVPKHLDGTPFYQQAIAQLERAKSKFPKNIWETYNDRVLKSAQPALQTLRKALKFPHMRLVRLVYEPKFSMTIEHFSYFREFARLLNAEAKLYKRKNKMDKAIENYCDIMKLCRQIGDEPFLIAFLSQVVIFLNAQRLLWEDLLSDTDVPVNLYQIALSELRAWDFERDFVRALQADRCIWVIELPDKAWEEAKVKTNLPNRVEFVVKAVVVSEEQLKLLRFYGHIIKIARKGAPYDIQAIQRITNDYTKNQGFLSDIIAPMSGVFGRANQIYAIRQLTETALMLRLYRCKHGHYPESLQALVPKYLPKVPVDPYDGKPMRYQKLSRGFKVWSVGGNGKDEGGLKVRDGWRESDRGDLVLESKL